MSTVLKPFMKPLYQLISFYDQSEKTPGKFIDPIRELFEVSTKSKKVKKNVMEKLSAILEWENIEFKDGFLEEKIKKLTGELHAENLQSKNTESRNIAYIDSDVCGAAMPWSSSNAEDRASQETFNESNKHQLLIKEFFCLMHEVTKKFIDEESKVIKKHPINLRQSVSIDSSRVVVKNNTIRQRRMNALARLFDSDEIKSPCIALALVKGHFIIGVNTPTIKNKIKLKENIDFIEKHLFKKASILQSFFKKITDFKNINDKSLESISKNTFRELESLGFSSRFLYNKYVEDNDRFKLDLDKITRSLLRSLKTNGTSGFSNEERETLLTKKPLTLFPNQDQEEELEGQIHADQIVLIATLKALKDEDISQLTRIKAPLKRISMDGITPQQPTPIGIPKLSCGACFANIYAYEPFVSCYTQSH